MPSLSFRRNTSAPRRTLCLVIPLMLLLAFGQARAADVAPSYTTPGGRAQSVVTLCPSSDGSYTASACAPVSITSVASTAAEAGHVLKAGAGTLYGLSVTTGSVPGYVLVLDSATIPADGAVAPKKCYQVGAGSTVAASWQPGPPVAFAQGITVVFSTTGCLSKTGSATAFISGEVQ